VSRNIRPEFQLLQGREFLSPFSFKGEELIKAKEYLEEALARIGPNATLEGILAQLQK
jgi:hypothetical protein